MPPTVITTYCNCCQLPLKLQSFTLFANGMQPKFLFGHMPAKNWVQPPFLSSHILTSLTQTFYGTKQKTFPKRQQNMHPLPVSYQPPQIQKSCALPKHKLILGITKSNTLSQHKLDLVHSSWIYQSSNAKDSRAQSERNLLKTLGDPWGRQGMPSRKWV